MVHIRIGIETIMNSYSGKVADLRERNYCDKIKNIKDEGTTLNDNIQM